MYREIIEKIRLAAEGKDRFIIAVDGRCGSGKTVFSQMLADELCADLVHIDYFYLPIIERKSGWDTTPAGNMDLDRFENTVLKPFSEGKDVTYYRFQQFGQKRAEDISLTGKKVLIIDGSYSMHPQIIGYYGIKIFMTCTRDKQIERLKVREGDHFSAFSNIWMDKEIFYHEKCEIISKADAVLDTTELF